MKYLVIDTDGQLYQRSAPRYDVALRDVGPEGWDRVRLHHSRSIGLGDLAAFVNDCGLLMPERYERGAGPQPYAGPVVLTGWDPNPYSDDPEVRGLLDTQIAALRHIHSDVRRAVGLDHGEPAPGSAWQAAMVEVSAIVRAGPVPPVRVITGEAEVLDWLRRSR